MHKSVYDHDIPTYGTRRAETPDIAWRDFMNAAPKSAKGKLAKGMPEATDIIALLNAISTQVSDMQGTLDRYTPFIEDAMAGKEKALEVESEMEELAFDMPPANDPFEGMEEDDSEEKEDSPEEEEGDEDESKDDEADDSDDESDDESEEEPDDDEGDEEESADEEEEDNMDKKARSNSKSADYEMSAEDFRAMCNDLHKAVRENERLRKMNVRQGMQIKSLESRITKMETGIRTAPIRKAGASVRNPAERAPAPVRKMTGPDASVRKRVRTYTPPVDAADMTKGARPAQVVQRPPSTAGFRQVPVNVDAVNKAADEGADGKPARRDSKFKLGTPDEVLKSAFGG